MARRPSTGKALESRNYDCPVCGLATVNVAMGSRTGMLHCAACGWSCSIADWNRMTDAQKKALRRTKSRLTRLKEALPIPDRCPKCNKVVLKTGNTFFCGDCGQRLR